jgi:hypothetical protein
MATGAAATAATSTPGATPAQITYDDYLVDHLNNPAVERADRFVARQERLGERPASAKATAAEPGYGREGCTAPEVPEIGAERDFWVSNYDLGQNEQITAVLAAISPHGYMWVQKEYYVPADQTVPERGFVTKSEAEEGLKDWESIYKIDRTYFGKQPDPDTPAQNLAPGLPADWRDADCDKHISILNFPIDTPVVGVPPTPSTAVVAGYFSSEHEYPNGDGENESPFSNEAEMFFMNSQRLDVGSDLYAGVIAHEFFHMIQFSNDYNEATWVNEGMADVAIAVNGFTDSVQGHIDAFQNAPDDHLLDWGGGLADYGEAFLFFDYLFTHYGQPENPDTDKLEAYGLAKLLTKTPPDGPSGVTKVIKTRSKALLAQVNRYYRTGNFKKVFADYLIANYVDDHELAVGQFGYENRTVHVKSDAERATPPGTTAAESGDSDVHPYAGDYYEFEEGTEGNLMASVEDPVAVIPATEGQPKPAGGYFAWSNRADEMITWLQRGADLRNVEAAQLKFKYWFQIEEDWDYAYVRVSTDGGKTFEFQNTAECGGRSTDPNGNNRAVAETGGITGDSAGWKTCTLDLTKYAGKKVLIRFEYDTDQATTEPGFVVDNVKLKAGTKTIWKTVKFENAKNPFKFGGDGILKWFRIKPLAKNKPLLQIVSITDGNVRRRILKRKAFSAVEDKFQLTNPARVSGGRSILVVSAVTPIATDPFTYSYSLDTSD